MNCKSISNLKSIVKYNSEGEPMVEGIISVSLEDILHAHEMLDSFGDAHEGWNSVICTALVGEEYQLFLVDIGWKMIGCNPNNTMILFDVCTRVDLDCFTEEELEEWNAHA